MSSSQDSNLHRLLSIFDAQAMRRMLALVRIEPSFVRQAGPAISRAVLAQAMNLKLLSDLLARVPTGNAYVADLEVKKLQLNFDHGALRTVGLSGMGELPPGEDALVRVLVPLGYYNAETYPLDRLGMTGRAYRHRDFPEALPQFFVSELHPERFSLQFRAAALRVTGGSEDPLNSHDLNRLDRLRRNGELDLAEATALLPKLVACFSCQHPPCSIADYELLRAESPEMAWIATEGNSFNHATDRVASLEKLVHEQQVIGRPLKARIEVSASGRVKQTAYRADAVDRRFVDEHGNIILKTVPGSFFEFIERAEVQDLKTGERRLDLAFDTSNAQGIFKMTAAS